MIFVIKILLPEIRRDPRVLGPIAADLRSPFSTALYLLTVEISVDLDSSVLCRKPTIPCVRPDIVVFQLKIHWTEMQLFCVLLTVARAVVKFDCRTVTNGTLTNGDQYLLHNLRHAVSVTLCSQRTVASV